VGVTAILFTTERLLDKLSKVDGSRFLWPARLKEVINDPADSTRCINSEAEIFG
jgi:hypothetical protein